MKQPFPPPKNVRQYLVRLLSRREYSEHELRQKLKQRGVPEAEAAEALAFVKKHDLQSDGRFAASRARSMGARKGNLAVARDLSSKGVSLATIEEALPELGDELERARKAGSRFEGKMAEEKDRARAWRFLSSRGFSGDVVKRVLRELGTAVVED